jgi:hypothetical protein
MPINGVRIVKNITVQCGTQNIGIKYMAELSIKKRNEKDGTMQRRLNDL